MSKVTLLYVYADEADSPHVIVDAPANLRALLAEWNKLDQQYTNGESEPDGWLPVRWTGCGPKASRSSNPMKSGWTIATADREEAHFGPTTGLFRCTNVVVLLHKWPNRADLIEATSG